MVFAHTSTAMPSAAIVVAIDSLAFFTTPVNARINPHTLRARMRKLKIDWRGFRAAPSR
jgi:hypothetical protein